MVYDRPFYIEHPFEAENDAAVYASKAVQHYIRGEWAEGRTAALISQALSALVEVLDVN
jgi:hypothetical protein